MKKIYLIALVFTLLGLNINSFAQLKLSGELRPRPEFQNGFGELRSEGDTANAFVSQRTRINVDYSTEKVKFKVVFQDVRIWGSTPQMNVSDNYLALHEAWAEVFFTKEFSLKLGRQELTYDDHRILGTVLWAQQSRSHDIGVFKYESDFKVHVGIAYNQFKDATTPDYIKYYKSMQFAWFHKDFSNLKLSVLALNNGLQAFDNTTSLLTKEVRYSQTLGTFVEGSISDVSLNGSMYYQMGKDRVNRSLSAYNFALNASLNINEAITVKAGAEILSGTAYDADIDKNNSFTPLYGTNHKFNGFMDYFYAGNRHLDNVGLNDFNIGGSWKNEQWIAKTTIHYFMSNAKQYDSVKMEEASLSLGTELDLSLGYNLNDWINFTAGYSQMFATRSMEILKGGSKDVTNNWAYLMITIKPTFLDTSK